MLSKPPLKCDKTLLKQSKLLRMCIRKIISPPQKLQPNCAPMMLCVFCIKSLIFITNNINNLYYLPWYFCLSCKMSKEVSAQLPTPSNYALDNSFISYNLKLTRE